MASSKQIAANRRNAQMSTGPKSRRGKNNSRTNSLKHGLYSREVVVVTGYGKENIDEFRSLLRDLVDHYGPVGPLEELLVDNIATTS